MKNFKPIALIVFLAIVVLSAVVAQAPPPGLDCKKDSDCISKQYGQGICIKNMCQCKYL